jgi:hypothetical protein
MIGTGTARPGSCVALAEILGRLVSVAQQLGNLTANPPRLISLNFVLISSPI